MGLDHTMFIALINERTLRAEHSYSSSNACSLRKTAIGGGLAGVVPVDREPGRFGIKDTASFNALLASAALSGSPNSVSSRAPRACAAHRDAPMRLFAL